ncbi:MAG: 50S ribosomal protein L29 [Streptococcus sp.]
MKLDRNQKNLLQSFVVLSQEELAKQENELEERTVSTFVSKHAAGQLDQTGRLKEVKKQIARIKTVQSEAK